MPIYSCCRMNAPISCSGQVPMFCPVLTIPNHVPFASKFYSYIQEAVTLPCRRRVQRLGLQNLLFSFRCNRARWPLAMNGQLSSVIPATHSKPHSSTWQDEISVKFGCLYIQYERKKCSKIKKKECEKRGLNRKRKKNKFWQGKRVTEW